MSRLILARHGQSVSNAVRRFQGVQDVALSELGERQAAALGQALRHRRVAAVYTSPLERARRTAEIAVEGLGLSVTQVHELRELSLGDWEGQTVEEISRLPGDPYTQWVRDPVACLPPGAEPSRMCSCGWSAPWRTSRPPIPTVKRRSWCATAA